MNKKRNVSYIKPEDPDFLKELKKQAGYDDTNHKFDKLQNNEEDFVDDEDSEKPQVVVLKKGDLTADEAEIEQRKIEKIESETKADLSQRVIFKAKQKQAAHAAPENNKRKKDFKDKSKKKTRIVLSFGLDEDDDE